MDRNPDLGFTTNLIKGDQINTNSKAF